MLPVNCIGSKIFFARPHPERQRDRHGLEQRSELREQEKNSMRLTGTTEVGRKIESLAGMPRPRVPRGDLDLRGDALRLARAVALKIER
jgi:hypothetical protein